MSVCQILGRFVYKLTFKKLNNTHTHTHTHTHTELAWSQGVQNRVGLAYLSRLAGASLYDLSESEEINRESEDEHLENNFTFASFDNNDNNDKKNSNKNQNHNENNNNSLSMPLELPPLLVAADPADQNLQTFHFPTHRLGELTQPGPRVNNSSNNINVTKGNNTSCNNDAINNSFLRYTSTNQPHVRLPPHSARSPNALTLRPASSPARRSPIPPGSARNPLNSPATPHCAFKRPMSTPLGARQPQLVRDTGSARENVNLFVRNDSVSDSESQKEYFKAQPTESSASACSRAGRRTPQAGRPHCHSSAKSEYVKEIKLPHGEPLKTRAGTLEGSRALAGVPLSHALSSSARSQLLTTLGLQWRHAHRDQV
jgi:hypothetical protein